MTKTAAEEERLEPNLDSAVLEITNASPRIATSLPRVRWRQSWIYRLATVASLILMTSGIASSVVAYQFFQQIAALTYQQDTESKLKENLAALREVHRLQQKLLVERLRPLVTAASTNSPHSSIKPEQIRNWLQSVDAITPEELNDLKIEPTDPSLGGNTLATSAQTPQHKPQLAITWLDSSKLAIAGHIVEFPKGPTYKAFKSAELVSQSYQLLGMKLNDDIMPRMTRSMSMIIVASFVLLGSIVILYASRFKRRVSEVLDGFRRWSEIDTNFRFADDYTGELQLITAQFNTMADEVEANRQRSLYLEKIASWQVMARKLAHEIKNPLTPIQMMVSQLKRRYHGEDSNFQKLLDDAQNIITEEISGLRRMVDHFSHFASLPIPQPKSQDLVTVCRHIVELQKNTYIKHAWYFVGPEQPLIVSFDEDLLRQVLLNLTKNAAEACHKIEARIGITVSDAGSDVLIDVQDNGPGIPIEYQNKIFEAYFTTKHTGPTPGMGLGLAICQKIVLDHAGKMSVSSEPGHTIFTIRLPKTSKRLA